ncbi:hypothetical protein KJ996_05585 [Patescibacteria group bacterium]|nr:hypothetical protein [Patescibacteria group bacterium]
MSIKRILLTSTALLLITGCSRSNLTLDLTFRTEDLAQISVLTTVSERVTERMAFVIEEDIPLISIDDARMTVTLMKKDSADILFERLSSPISFRIMREAVEEEEADIENDQYGRFMETGITEQQLYWIDAEEREGGTGVIQINFTDEGASMWQQLLEENQGKKVGVFTRGGLVALHTVQEGGFKDKIIITGIPSAELAKVFADDVNVGAYVTFTRVH